MYVKKYHKLKFKSILKMLYQLNGVLESKKKNTLILVLYFSATNHLARKNSL